MPHIDLESKVNEEIAKLEEELKKEMPLDKEMILDSLDNLQLRLEDAIPLVKSGFSDTCISSLGLWSNFGMSFLLAGQSDSQKKARLRDWSYHGICAQGSFQTIATILDFCSPSTFITSSILREAKKRNEKLWDYFRLRLLKERPIAGEFLHYAARYNLYKLIEFASVEMQVDLDTKDSNGKTPLDWAIELQNKEAATMLYRRFALATEVQQQKMFDMGIKISVLHQERERELLEMQRKLVSAETQSSSDLSAVQQHVDQQQSKQQSVHKALVANFSNQKILHEQLLAQQRENDSLQNQIRVLTDRVSQMELQINQLSKSFEKVINPSERASAAASTLNTSNTFFLQPQRPM